MSLRNRSSFVDRLNLRRLHLLAAIPLLSAVLTCLAAPTVRAADTATGSIVGRVSNADNGTNLTNARIEVEGTHQTAFTDRFGDYRLNDVPAGSVKLHVFFTGLLEQVREVAVTAGATTSEDFSLSASAAPTTAKAKGEEIVTLDTFVVASAKDTDQRSIALNEQRFTPMLKTVVSTDQFGDITEGNVGEFVKFLPGISVGYTASDVRNISIRGVGSQYTAVMLDGFRVASADSGSISYSSTGGGTRTTELEQISINNAARSEIIKARTPDLPADALGGSLNLISKSAFEYNKPTLSYRVVGAMNTNARSLSATPGLRSNATTHKILPSVDFSVAVPLNKKFGFTVSVLDSNIFNVQYRSNPQWAQNGTLGSVTGGTSALATSPFLQKYTLQDGPKTTHRKAVSVTGDWKISSTDVLSIRLQDNFYDSMFGNRNLNFDTGGSMPLAYTSTATNGALGKGKVNFGSSFRHKFGVTYNLGTQYVHTGRVWTFDAGVNYSHASAHYRDSAEGYFSSVTYQISNTTVNYGKYDGVTPQQIEVFDKSGKNTLGNVWDVRNANYVITQVQNNPVDATDSFFTQQANFKRSLDLALPTTIKFGAQLQYEMRDINNYKLTWTPTGDLAKAGAANAFNLWDNVYNIPPPYVPYSVVWPSNTALYNLYLTNPSLFSTSASSNWQSQVQGSLLFKEQIWATYFMGDTKAMNDRLRFVYGLRFERTDDEGWGPLATKSGTTTTYTMRGSHATSSYSGGYPSMNIIYNIKDDLILRASYNRAVGRPDIVNLVPNVSLPDLSSTGATVSVSNPLLKAEQANNYDLSLEYYFGRSGVISAGVFRKDFVNFWGKSNVVGDEALAILNTLNVANAQSYINQGDIVSTTVNSGTAHVTGMELNYQQSLEALTRFAKGVSVYANMTAVRLNGPDNADFSAFVSKTINWGLAYSNRRISAKLNWNYRGQEKDTPTTVSGVKYYEYFAPRLYLDANFEYRISPHFGVFINGRNLTNVPQDNQRYAPGITPDYAKLYRREMFGTAITFGIKGTF